MLVANNVTELVGKTPMLALDRLYRDSKTKVYAKLELFNPMSIKDRPVLHMIRQALARGAINSDIEVVEASSGNTAIALSTLGALMGFPVRVYISEEVTLERRRILASFGAKIVLTPAAEHTRGARERAIAYCKDNPDKTFFLNQHGNPDNPGAHELTTGPEIWEQLDGNIDAVVIALGTCGTFDGVARYMKSKNPNIKVYGVEPAQSPLYSGGKQGKHRIDGMGPGLVSDIFQNAAFKPDEIIKVEDDEAFEWTRRVAQKEGLFVGLTSGALASAVGRLVQRDTYDGKTIVTFVYDTGERYLSVTDLFPEGNVTSIP
ncbi:MAG: cysteine synthase family protein [Hyphomicrobiaceae bacterium]|nr:cysteine synthase family protein [Hyphomicrobiaceae bacterium]